MYSQLNLFFQQERALQKSDGVYHARNESISIRSSLISYSIVNLPLQRFVKSRE
jgi:hypothetical protein